MDGTRFDALTRAVAGGFTRRRFLTGLAAAVLGLRERQDSSAASCRALNSVCRESANCCSGFCKANGSDGRRRCSCPPSSVACDRQCVDPVTVFQSDPQNCGSCGNRCPRTQCQRAICTGGVCGLEAETGLACDDGNSCTTDQTCQQDGTCGGGTTLGDGTGCGTGGQCTVGVCLRAFPSCSGTCGANAATVDPDIGNLCWFSQNQCLAASCGDSTDCGAGSFCGLTNSCGGGLEGRCFVGCNADAA